MAFMRSPLYVDKDGWTVYSEEEFQLLSERIRTKELATERRELVHREIERLLENLNVDKEEKSRAFNMYGLVIRTDLINNYSSAPIAATVVYTVCREQRIPRTAKDVGLASYVKIDFEGEQSLRQLARTSTIQRLYNHVCDRLGRTYLPISPQKFGQRYCDKLNLDDEIQEFVKVALNQVENEISGVAPQSVAAGAICYSIDVFDLDLTQWEIQKATYCSMVTIRKRRDHIKEIVGRE